MVYSVLYKHATIYGSIVVFTDIYIVSNYYYN